MLGETTMADDHDIVLRRIGVDDSVETQQICCLGEVSKEKHRQRC